MTTKNNLWQTLTQRFYGIDGPLDEYKERELHAIGSRIHLILWWYMLLSSLIALIASAYFPAEMVLYVLIGSNFLLQFLSNIYIAKKIKEKQLSDIDIAPQDFETRKKMLGKQTIKAGVVFGLLMGIQQIIWKLIFDKTPMLETIQTPRFILTCLLSGIFFGVFIYKLINRLKIDDSE